MCGAGSLWRRRDAGSAREFIGREVFARTQAVPWNNVRRKRRADMKRVFGDREASVSEIDLVYGPSLRVRDRTEWDSGMTKGPSRSYLGEVHQTDGRTQGLKESNPRNQSHGWVPKFRAPYLGGDIMSRSSSPARTGRDGGDSPMGHAHDISIERVLGFYEGIVRIQTGRSEEEE